MHPQRARIFVAPTKTSPAELEHAVDDAHKHMAYAAECDHGFVYLARDLRERGIFVNFTRFGDFSDAVRYLTAPSVKKPLEVLDDAPASHKLGAMRIARRYADPKPAPRPAADSDARRGAGRPPKVKTSDVCEAIINNNLHTEGEVMAASASRQRAATR